MLLHAEVLGPIVNTCFFISTMHSVSFSISLFGPQGIITMSIISITLKANRDP